jgi:cysteine-rich repeat protein
MSRRLGVIAVLALLGCTGTADAVFQDTRGAEGGTQDLVADVPRTGQDAVEPDFAMVEDNGVELVFDVAEADVAVEPQCAPGEGCFLDPCTENIDCQSGWCVDHLGDAVCTMSCQEECPPGWNCQQVAGTDPDLVFVCVSNVANLCKPCAGGEQCKSVGGAEDVCLDYGNEGAFCGSGCLGDDDCPWGFSCADAVTVDGIASKQCVADAGVCPCTARSVALVLWTPCVVASDAGNCIGKRVCTVDGLSACDAAMPVAESCNGLDDDCDGSVDEPNEVGGDLENLCNDDNDCTKDICDGEAGCSYQPLQGDECKDGNPCTVADHCEQGVCVGSPVECDDSNPCTDDSCAEGGGCLFKPNNAACDDGDVCTLGDHCAAGECAGEAVDCECLVDADCGGLEDGDLCNGTLACDTSKLPHLCRVDEGTVVSCPAPEGADGFCQAASCDPATGQCSMVAANNGKPCDDDDPCTLGDSCQDGTCLAGPAVNCNDGNPCTDDACSPGQGCTHLPGSGPCNDGDVCTLGDLCQAGACVGGNGTLSCDDNNPCTDDGCDPDVGCTFVANQAACSDGNACTLGDHCDNKVCVPTGQPSCDDDNLCTNDACDAAQGCIHLLNSVPCNDGDKCTTDDICQLGECVGGGGLVCDDSNPCTADSCAPKIGCQFTPVNGACDDGNACTLNEQCGNGLCIAGAMLGCDDTNVCTTDSCDPESGCIYAFNNAACSDDDICTINESCVAGQCVSESMLACDDENPCTDDSCDPETGCVHTPNQADCSDDNACTAGDHCQGGECLTTGMLTCDDANLCTNDNCDPDVGCVYSANNNPCDDGNLCTENDACANGKCVGGGNKVCPDDNNTCTTDSCDADSGCIYTPSDNCCGNGVVEGGEECDDGNQVNDDGCSASCQSDAGCSNAAEYHYEVTPGLWACVNNAIINSYDENFSMCAAGYTPATYKLVQGLQMPSLQQHQVFAAWHNQVMPNNGGYIRTGQKRRGGCTLEEHGELYVPLPDWGYHAASGWQDLFLGGSSCNKDTGSANNVSGHPLAGVVCVKGEYEPPKP